MISSSLEKGFSLVWAIVKLNLQFIGLTLLGGVIFGLGPAFQTISDLIQTFELDYREQTWRFAFNRFKANFIKSNLHFYLFFFFSLVVGYNLYLATQIQGLLWLVIDFVLLVILSLLSVYYLYLLITESTYDLTLSDLLKLSFISLFLDFGVFMKILIGLVGIIAFTWSMKGLLLFSSFSLSVFWVHALSRKTRAVIDGKLFHES